MRTEIVDEEDVAGGSSIASRIVDISLNNIKDKKAQELFLLLSLLPEDRACPSRMLELLWVAKHPEEKRGALQRAQIRKRTHALMDSNLILGDANNGVKLHDLIRDQARLKWAAEDTKKILTNYVDKIIDNAPSGGGWNCTSRAPDHSFVTETLTALMKESLSDEITLTSRCLSWLETPLALSSFPAIAAARAIGLKRIVQLAELAEATAYDLKSAIYFSAAFRLTKENKVIDVKLGARAARLFRKVRNKGDFAFLEVGIICLLSVTLDSTDPMALEYQERLTDLLAAKEFNRPEGPLELASLAHMYSSMSFYNLGVIGEFTGIHMRDVSQEKGWTTLMTAIDIASEAIKKIQDPVLAAVLCFACNIFLFSIGSRSATEKELECFNFTSAESISMIRLAMEHYDYSTCHAWIDSLPYYELDFGCYPPLACNIYLLMSGDIRGARAHCQRCMASIEELGFENYIAAGNSNLAMILLGACVYGVPFLFAGMSSEAISGIACFKQDYENIEKMTCRPIFDQIAKNWLLEGVDSEGDSCIVLGKKWSLVFGKMASFLHRNDISHAEFGAFMDDNYPLKDSEGRIAYGGSAFMLPHVGGEFTMVPFVYNKLGRPKEAIIEAERFIKKGPFAKVGHAMVEIAMGRALAELRKFDEAETHFWKSIKIAKACAMHAQLPLCRIIAIRDLIVLVLEPREKSLSDALLELAQALLEVPQDQLDIYTTILNCGLDARALVEIKGKESIGI
eukprot:UC4_evm1s972